jgi:hypothetical protein
VALSLSLFQAYCTRFTILYPFYSLVVTQWGVGEMPEYSTYKCLNREREETYYSSVNNNPMVALPPLSAKAKMLPLAIK